jgi:hypothetical protein
LCQEERQKFHSMSLVNLLFGKPLASDEDRAEKIGTATGVPIFGLDALGSAAYGPEAALTLLIPLGAAGILLFGGVTDRLIPLLAVGAFLAFTMSQSGMVKHWKRAGGRYSRHSMLINGLGAIATAITAAVVIVSKFAEGAWITLLIIPTLMLLMGGVRAHYRRVDREIAYRGELSTDNLRPPFP